MYGDCYLSVGLSLTHADIPGAPDEISLYAGENHWNGPKTIRRYAVRQDGFVSLHAGGAPAFTETGTFDFTGSRLHINASTSAVGSIRIGFTDPHGVPLPGFTVEDCDDIFTDRIDYPVSWRGGYDIQSLSGRPVRMRILMTDADLYSFNFS